MATNPIDPCAPPELPPILRFEQGDDHIIADDAQLPFELLSTLGFGQSGSVEKVRDKNTGKVYARKTMWIRARRMKEETERIFFNEINIIRGLDRHRHIIAVFATYMAKREICLILEPVANEGDLEQFLETLYDDHSGVRLERAMPVLERAFGCLASALAFMHLKKIRHKDIKPQNILVHQGSVIYTDFGYSLDCSNLQRSTTEGRPNALTRRYSAPEVLNFDRRNSLSDVFSLGCVFLEILSEIIKCPDLCPPEKEDFAVNLSEINSKLKWQNLPEKLSFLGDIITGMISISPTNRTSSIQLAETILQVPGFCCVECSKGPDVLATSKRKRLEQTTRSFDHEAVTDNNVMITEPPTVSSQNQSFLGWIWSEPHRNYYYVTYDDHGCPIYEGTAGYTYQSPTDLLKSNPADDWYERYDPSYRMRTSKERQEFFVVGRVFAVLWNEPAGDTDATFDKDAYSHVRFGGYIHTMIRRFIVVKLKQEFVYACAITTYGGRGTLKNGCVPSEHAVVYFTGTQPTAIPGEYERGMTKEPIEIVPAKSDPPMVMKPESRIRFSNTHPVALNVKVKDVGRVSHRHIGKLLNYWRKRT